MEELDQPIPNHQERRRRRKLAGLTQLELGRLAGISRSSLSKFELGYETLPPDKLTDLDNALNVSIHRRREELGSANIGIPTRPDTDRELSPTEFVEQKDRELGQRGRGRRAILRCFTSLGEAVVAAAIYEEFIKPPGKALISLLYDPDADQKLLGRLFGVGGQSGTGALLAAADHPFKKPPDGAEWYPTEVRNCVSYKNRFFDTCTLRQVRKDPDIMPADGLVLFGSQVSNYKTREYFGNWLRPKPQLNITTAQWKVKLHWNLYTPDYAVAMARWQFGAQWKTWRHRIGALHGDEFMSKEREGELVDDYLLVTALPLSGNGKERILVFAGLHGPGQKATNMLFLNPPIGQLRTLEKVTTGEPFYQALFHVPLQKEADGEFAPKHIELVEAKSLEPSFS